jgi:VIT1/CCC1 family predicted Fe2+/Mn2+ transporter
MMAKNKDSKNKIHEQIIKDALKEKEVYSDGKKQGIISVVLGSIGFILPIILFLFGQTRLAFTANFFRLPVGIVCLVLAVYASQHGSRTYGIIGGIIGLLNAGGFFILGP